MRLQSSAKRETRGAAAGLLRAKNFFTRNVTRGRAPKSRPARSLASKHTMTGMVIYHAPEGDTGHTKFSHISPESKPSCGSPPRDNLTQRQEARCNRLVKTDKEEEPGWGPFVVFPIQRLSCGGVGAPCGLSQIFLLRSASHNRGR